MDDRRFVVVQVNGQFYECERPFGAHLIRACVEVSDGKVARVWIEDAAPPLAFLADDDGDDGMEGEDE